MHVQRAMRDIEELPETALVRVSSLYETAPMGMQDQPAFINAVAEVVSTLSPHEFLARLQAIELQHGRLRNSEREVKNGPRTLDLDILMFDEMQFSERGLTIPHPRMHERAFVLVPLQEIAPEAVVPGMGIVSDLLSVLDCTGVTVLQLEEQ